MSPEQAEGRQSIRVRIFFRWAVFYEMLTGDGHRRRHRCRTVSSILRDTPRPINELQPGLPREPCGWCIALARTPSTVYQSAIDLRHGRRRPSKTSTRVAPASHPTSNRARDR